jgi:nitroreductase
MAGYAPSVHNTQPWRWTVLADRMELSAVRDRQLATTDPDGRLMLVSCGAALHHARVALAAAGWGCTVTRLPDPGRPELLAVVELTTHHPADPSAVRLGQAIEMRRTDRRPLSAEVLADDVVHAIAEAVRAEGPHLHVLSGDQVYDLASAADRAGAVERADEAVQEEIAYWIGRGDGLGVPASTLPAEQPATTVPERDFGQLGSLPIAPGHDRAARYGMVYGDEDEPLWWLRAGEGLSAAWLTATRLGASLLPLTAAVEVPTTRMALRRLIADLGWPYVVVRLGIADPDHAGPPHAPRLATPQIVDTSEVRHLLDRA